MHQGVGSTPEGYVRANDRVEGRAMETDPKQGYTEDGEREAPDAPMPDDGRPEDERPDELTPKGTGGSRTDGGAGTTQTE
jgi:hypothetical protein